MGRSKKAKAPRTKRPKSKGDGEEDVRILTGAVDSRYCRVRDACYPFSKSHQIIEVSLWDAWGSFRAFEKECPQMAVQGAAKRLVASGKARRVAEVLRDQLAILDASAGKLASLDGRSKGWVRDLSAATDEERRGLGLRHYYIHLGLLFDRTCDVVLWIAQSGLPPFDGFSWGEVARAASSLHGCLDDEHSISRLDVEAIRTAYRVIAAGLEVYPSQRHSGTSADLTDQEISDKATHGITLYRAALVLAESDKEIAKELKKKWQNSTKHKLPQPVGVNGAQTFLYNPAELINFLKKIKGTGGSSKFALLQMFDAQLRPITRKSGDQ